jgi:ATP-dependent Clp protease ATP-binding subunit ClpA
MSAIGCGSVSFMFEAFSERSRKVIFLARLKAGERGARLIEVEDLLAALVVEDQGMSEKIFSNSLGDGTALVSKVPPHGPFFSPETAEHLLSRIKEIQPQSVPVGLTNEMPISPALGRVFDSANRIHAQFQRSQIEPLLLLAAIATQAPNKSTELLSECGITQESVLAKLQETSDS